MKLLFQLIAFFSPSPINIWLHKIGGGIIGKGVTIHPGVLILAEKVIIADYAKIKFGTMIHARIFKLGKKSSIGFFSLINGSSDFIVGDACVIGARSMINCDRQVIFRNYSGNGPACYIYTHGSFLPVTEGFRAVFAPVEIKEKVWIQMNCKIGPGVTIGEGTIVLPGSVILEKVDSGRMVVGDPARMVNVPLLRQPMDEDALRKFAYRILNEYHNWLLEFKKANSKLLNGKLLIYTKKQNFSITVDDNSGDIVLFTKKGITHPSGMYFNLVDLKTDNKRHPIKIRFEDYLRLHYGLIFL